MSKNELLTLQNVFSNRIFRIPDFQRGYAWNEEQWNDLWEDINGIQGDKKHYTGMLSVECIDANDPKWEKDLWLINQGKKLFYVIDGQQRLTTLIILLNELLKGEGDLMYETKKHWRNYFLYKSYNGNTSFLFGYEKDNPSDEFFKTKILEQASCSAANNNQSVYTLNLKKCKEYFAEKIKDYDQEQKEDLFRKITTQLTFNYYEIDDTTEVFVTFETMNNRGKPLSVLELLKNRLVYLSVLLMEDENDYNRLRDDINEVWKTLYEYLGKNQDKPLNEDDFLQNHWITYFPYSRDTAKVFKTYLLSKEFTKKRVFSGELSSEQVREYIDSLQKSIKTWYYMANIDNSPYSEEIKSCLERLQRAGWGAFKPLTMAILTKLEEESKEEDKDKIATFLKAAERFNFLIFRLCAFRSNTKNTEFYGFARAFYRENRPIEEIIKRITQLTDETFDADTARFNISQVAKSGDGFFDWTGLRYFLYEYEQYLQEQAKGVSKVSWQDITYETIEHIYPRTATDDYWTSRFDDESSAFYLNSLGNLLLLSRAKNSKLGNADFETKKKRTDSSGYFNGSYSEIEVAQYHEWTKETIIERGKKMLAFMQQRWNFTIEKPDSLLRPQEESNNNQTKD